MEKNGLAKNFYGDERLQAIEYLTKNADQVQLEVLSAILQRNAKTEYLTRHGLNGRIDRKSFKKCIPIVEYEDMKPEIQRIANGDTSPILSTLPISEFLTSSGTSAGERKLMPTVAEELHRKQFLYSLLMPVMNQYLQGLDEGKGLYFLFVKSETKTPGGLVARPVLTSYYKSPQFSKQIFDPYNAYTSPLETILCPDAYQSMYCQMLCGLIQNMEVLRMGAVFASGFLRAIKFLEEHWKELCQDIHDGKVQEAIRDEGARKAVSKMLQPNPKLANFIKAECSKPTWEGIIKRLWPRVKYIEVIVTGTMSQYINTLNYYSGGLPLVCTMYASSECYFGINLNPLCKPSEVSYTLLPNMAFFEFLPLKRVLNDHINIANGHMDEDQTVDLVDVKLGKEYELIVTTYSGLYRYKVGDVLKVVGFHNAAPQFKFICRKNVVLSIDSDKTDEESLHKAVTKAAKHLETYGGYVIEYTSYVDATTIPGHYVLFWEVRSEKEIAKSVLEECCLIVEECLDSVYRQCRNCDKSIGSLEIRVVKDGTFDQVMDLCLSRGSSFNQYKTPRCITFKPVLELLNSRVTAKYFSPKFPTWVPGRVTGMLNSTWKS